VDADLDQDWAWPQSHVESLGVATNSWTKYETITHVSGRVVGESRAWAATYHFSCNGWRLAPLRGNKRHDLRSYANKTFHEGQHLLPESLACAIDAYTCTMVRIKVPGGGVRAWAPASRSLGAFPLL
jgi:hypothetical protein